MLGSRTVTMSPKQPRKPLRSTQIVPVTGDVGSARSGRRARGTRQLLVVDPVDETRRAVVDHYDRQGWTVREASTIRQAIDAALDQQPDVMIVEFNMPSVNPRHLFRTLRSSVEHDVVIVGVATPSPVLSDQVRDAAADVVMRKPVDLSAIDALVVGVKVR